MKRFLLGIVGLIILAVPVFSSTRLDLNHGWYFCTDPKQQGESSAWQKQMPEAAHPLDLPNTWNVGPLADYVGQTWYFRTFSAPVNMADLRTQLHFGAVFYSAQIWLNGVEVGRHDGGYTAFSIDITPYLRAENFLAVKVDNTITASTIPGLAMRGDDHTFDWWNYGGIVRDVWLNVGGPLQVGRQQIRTRISNQVATVEDVIHLANKLSAPEQVKVTARAFDSVGRLAASETQTVTIRTQTESLPVSLKISSPQLWGIDHPNLYRMVLQFHSSAGKLLDEHSETFGVRTVEIHDRHLLINGERVRLTGMDRHEEAQSEGLAETTGTMRYDYDDMRALQVTLTRPVHYPQNPYILEYADRHGILLIPEIPVWQFSENQLKDPKVIEAAKQQIREMIEEAGNHPSIFAWSVCNESATATPGGIAYFSTMRDYIRSLDPDRYVSFADDNLPKLSHPEQSAANDADFLMMNQYFGSWHGPEEGLSAALDKVNTLFPGKMMIISEFGLPGTFADTAASADRMRAHVMAEQLPELAKRDWIAGAILWCYQDYKSHRNLRPGHKEGFVDHGVVDEYRQRKPSYYVWKDLNAPASLSVKHGDAADGSTAFTVEIKPNVVTELPFYPMRDYKLVWQLMDKDGTMIGSGEQALADVTSRQTFSRVVKANGAQTVRVGLLRPTGEVAAEKLINLAGPKEEKIGPAVQAQKAGVN